MPNKNVPNGFYMFMLEEQKKIKAQTKRAPSMGEMPGICKESWKMLSAEEKSRYDQLAKQEKARMRGGAQKDLYRRDNQGQIIAHRKDKLEMVSKRRHFESKAIKESWVQQDVRDLDFHVIDFQVMYDERTDDLKLPLEVGLVCFSLRQGIKKYMHTFIDPGDVPQGMRHVAAKHSENTHQIPLNFEKGDKNMLGIWMQIEKFLVEDPKVDDFPPIFCLSDNVEIVLFCLDFIHFQAATGEPNRIHKVYCIEDLVACLMSTKSEKAASLSQIKDLVIQNRWDYCSTIRCDFHEEKDCSYCSISIVRRQSFAVFDILSNLLDFKLTAQHVPEDSAQSYTVVHPSTFNRGGDRERGFGKRERGWERGWGDNDQSSQSGSSRQSHRQASPTYQFGRDERSAEQPTSRYNTYQYQPPQVARVEVNLDEVSEDDVTDEEEEEDALKRDEIKSTANLYNLKELRKPKAPSHIVQGPVTQDLTAKVGIGRGMGRASPVNPIGRPAVPPPPGFAPIQGSDQSSDFPELSSASSWGRGRGVSANTAPATASSTNAWAGRGRGLPPQAQGAIIGGRGRGLPPQSVGRGSPVVRR